MNLGRQGRQGVLALQGGRFLTCEIIPQLCNAGNKIQMRSHLHLRDPRSGAAKGAHSIITEPFYTKLCK
ncbi:MULTISPECIES: hypothetical protein [unclassified Nostoc]|uniref:hypothetical protein n=1 Tax=unclassified Nostoc TaxID=2593658 RepID=UPI002AD4526F|nr:hypothetical protein [Nostoc sp. DedQUE03]MDZ7974117.1 hypothetical protein [Nostoc sp. DedQUE03]MDZ8048120.1 hypothetical protein [Nostoc sp. DedQUE02]